MEGSDTGIGARQPEPAGSRALDLRGVVLTMTLLAVLATSLWLLAWRLGGWLAWGAGSILLNYGVVSWMSMVLLVARLVSHREPRMWQPEPIRAHSRIALVMGAVPAVLVGLWLSLTEAPLVSILVLPGYTIVERLLDARFVRPWQGFERAPLGFWIARNGGGVLVGYGLGWLLLTALR